ncbi:MAG: glucosaminidase domain-containing protein [Dysgonamonadaceae bacterium]|jgi:LysM repeat protein|nr:glucosaminidase domain-containing protein [Dysgonamonadaceae bacterium]
MKTNTHKIFILFALLCAGLVAQAQRQLKSHLDYIEKHKHIAIKHREQYQIPASITLAQALLESGAGLSELALSSNNHFGIKCHAGWQGERVYRRDDNPNDCFRKYKKIEDSYEDHSRFLYNHPRYSELFSCNITDYEAWARGLQKCGYATDKAYANKLIKFIEDYQLYLYDQKFKSVRRNQNKKTSGQLKRMRPTYITHGLLYVEAEANDSFDKIAYDMGFKVKKLLKYNEVPENFPLRKGDIVYLEMKKKKADPPYSSYVVKIGDSMHRISQRYGIRLKNLYKMNGKDSGYVPTEGDVLRLR